MLSATLNHARKLARNGKPVFPCRQDNKRPLIEGGFKNATTDEKQLRAWWEKWPDAMIGMPTGDASGVWVLDVDAAKEGEAGDGHASLAELTGRYGPLPSTRTHATPSGGQHLLFKYPAGREVRNSASKLGPLLDVRGEGGYIVIPPSVNAEGNAYKVTDASKAVDAPDWLLELVAPLPTPEHEKPEQHTYRYHGGPLHPYVQAAVDGEIAKVTSASQGARNHTLNAAAYALGRWVAGGELLEGEARAMLFQAAQSCGLVADDGEHAVHKTISSGLESGKKEPRQAPASSRNGNNSYNTTKQPVEEPEEPEESRLLPPPPPVPLEAFPPQIAALLEEASEAFAAPMQIPAACLLGLLSCLVGGSRHISLRASWKEPGNIWIATVAASGIGKTPCAAAFFKPVKTLEHEAFKAWKDEYASYENELEFCRKERARAKSREQMPDKPTPPNRRQVYVDDATVEALGEVIAENPRGIMWRKDELSGLIADMDKYAGTGSVGGTRARLLSSYDGQEWKTSRASNPARNLYIPHAYVGIFGGIQPAMLSKVFETGIAGIDEASGFLQRFMLIRAERDKPSYWTERSLSQESRALLNAVAGALWSWDIEYDENDRPLKKVIPVSSQAKAAFVQWFNGIAQEEFLSQNAALLSKLKGQAQRLCLLLHCLDAALAGSDGMSLVVEDTMRRALLLADWVKEHQAQCWRFFTPEKGAKQANPIEQAIMHVVVDEADRIETDGWKISNERLFCLVEKKLGMPGLSAVKLGRAASGLGMGQCKVDRDSKGRSVTKELIETFKSTVRSDRTDRNLYGARKKIADGCHFEPTATDRADIPAWAVEESADGSRSDADGMRTDDPGYNPEFDFNDPDFPDEDRVII